MVPINIETVNTTLCTNDSSVDLSDLSTEEYQENGYWNDPESTGSLIGRMLDPSLLEIGSYRFTYSSEGSCTENATIFIEINDDCNVLCGADSIKKNVSKAITPNADGHNDYFQINLDTECGFRFDVEIFNRWGSRVYSGKNYQNTWDGYSPNAAFGANQLPSGVYFYVLKEVSKTMKPIQGHFYLGTKSQ